MITPESSSAVLPRRQTKDKLRSEGSPKPVRESQVTFSSVGLGCAPKPWSHQQVLLLGQWLLVVVVSRVSLPAGGRGGAGGGGGGGGSGGGGGDGGGRRGSFWV